MSQVRQQVEMALGAVTVQLYQARAQVDVLEKQAAGLSNQLAALAALEAEQQADAARAASEAKKKADAAAAAASTGGDSAPKIPQEDENRC